MVAVSRAFGAFLVAEGVGAVGFGVWLVVSAAGVAEVAEFSGTHPWTWAALLGAQVAAMVIVPGGALVVAGSRWWSAPAAFGGWRGRWFSYAVLCVHVLVVVLGVVTGALAAAAVGLVGVIVSVAAVVAGARGGAAGAAAHVRHGIPWRKLALAAVAVVVLASAGAGIGAAVTEDDTESPLGLLEQPTYPREAVVCSGPVDETCARRVAQRAGRTVAWLPDDEAGLRSQAFVVYAKAATPTPLAEGRVVQELRAGRVHLSLSTHRGRRTFDGRLVGHVRVGDVTADAYAETSNGVSTAELEWSRDGVAYRLSAFRVSEDSASVIAAARSALAAVRYSTP